MSAATTTVYFTMPLQAAGTDRKTHKQFDEPGDWRIESINFEPDDTVATHATNYTDITLTNETDSQVLHTLSTASTATTAGTGISVTLTEGTARELTDGDQLSFDKTDSGTGAALGGTYTIALKRLRL